MSDLTEEQQRQHLAELLKGFDTAMLVTRAPDFGMHARPLALAEQRGDGRLTFATRVDSPKVLELTADPHVTVTMQDSRRYVAIVGTAHVTRDRALVDALWSDAWKVWFPKGKDDPNLCLVVVEPYGAEYWDQAGVKGARYLFEAVKAYAKGTTPASDASQHAKLPL